MLTSKGQESLIRHRRAQSQLKQRDVMDAIRDLLTEGCVITVSEVSRRAKVSREFIHKHRHLHDAVVDAAGLLEQQRSAKANIQASTNVGLRSDRATLAGRVEKQKTQIAELEMQLQKLLKQQKLWFGSQLADTQRIDPETHAELRLTNERMMADNAGLIRQLAEARRLIAVLEDSLSASRQAHAEDLRKFQQQSSTLVAFERRKR